MFLPAGYRIDAFPNTITITTPDGTTTESTDSFGSATTYRSLSVLRSMLGPPPLVTKRADENQGDEVGPESTPPEFAYQHQGQALLDVLLTDQAQNRGMA